MHVPPFLRQPTGTKRLKNASLPVCTATPCELMRTKNRLCLPLTDVRRPNRADKACFSVLSIGQPVFPSRLKTPPSRSGRNGNYGIAAIVNSLKSEIADGEPSFYLHSKKRLYIHYSRFLYGGISGMPFHHSCGIPQECSGKFSRSGHIFVLSYRFGHAKKFCCRQRDFRFLLYAAISSSLPVSITYCSSRITASRSFGRYAVTG